MDKTSAVLRSLSKAVSETTQAGVRRPLTRKMNIPRASGGHAVRPPPASPPTPKAKKQVDPPTKPAEPNKSVLDKWTGRGGYKLRGKGPDAKWVLKRRAFAFKDPSKSGVLARVKDGVLAPFRYGDDIARTLTANNRGKVTGAGAVYGLGAAAGSARDETQDELVAMGMPEEDARSVANELAFKRMPVEAVKAAPQLAWNALTGNRADREAVRYVASQVSGSGPSLSDVNPTSAILKRIGSASLAADVKGIGERLGGIVQDLPRSTAAGVVSRTASSLAKHPAVVAFSIQELKREGIEFAQDRAEQKAQEIAQRILMNLIRNNEQAP